MKKYDFDEELFWKAYYSKPDHERSDKLFDFIQSAIDKKVVESINKLSVRCGRGQGCGHIDNHFEEAIAEIENKGKEG